MLIRRLTGYAIVLLLLAAPLAAQNSTKPITEKGLVNALRIGGIKESGLVEQINRRGVSFVLTPEIEQTLRAAGASDAVVNAVRSHYRMTAAAPAPPASAAPPAAPPVKQAVNAAPSLPSAPGIYLHTGGRWTPLPEESVNWKQGVTDRFRKQITGNVAGQHSGVSSRLPLNFLLRLSPGDTLFNHILVLLHSKGDGRTFKASQGSSMGGDEVGYQATKLAEDVYEIHFAQGSGDYAFLRRREIPGGSSGSGHAYTFRVPD